MRDKRLWFAVTGLLLVFLIGCAAMAPQPTPPPPIPPGKRMLVLETGGIESLNFAVFDQATGEKVVETRGLTAYLSPGTYKVVVQTDLDEPVVLDNVEIEEAEELHVTVPVGRFIMTVSQTYKDEEGETRELRVRPRFEVYNYDLSRVLARGVITFPPKRHIAPIGDYKVSIYLAGTAEGRIIRPAEVRFGRIYPLRFEFTSAAR